MRFHELKIKSEYLDEILDGRKTFEIRNDDRNYQIGDLIHFTAIDGESARFDGTFKSTHDNLYMITYILKNVPEYGLGEGYCIFSIKPAIRIY